MKTFDVLDANCSILGNNFLQASAGTGKTFAIENVVLRLLLEEGVNLSQILIVTFTKAATHDLKIRIKAAVEKAILDIKSELPFFHFLKLYSSEDLKKESLKRLNDALNSFEEAQIFTIHSFCFRALQEGSLEASLFIDEEEKSFNFLKESLLYSIDPSIISISQMQLLLKKYPAKTLLEKLSKFSAKGVKKENFSDLFKQFQSALIHFKSYDLTYEKLKEEFTALSSFYLKTAQIKQDDVDEQLSLLCRAINGEEARDFDKLLLSKLSLFQIIDKKRQKKKASLSNFRSPLFEELKDKIYPIIQKGSDSAEIMSLLGEFIANNVEKRSLLQDRLTSDMILKAMKESLDHEVFKEKIAKKYHGVIVDEFQDTDPIQWEILERLFLNKNHLKAFYLVGDPKQSIYAFRKADLYTYFKAADKLGHDSLKVLDTNFRSTPKLVDSLNRFFENSPILQLPSLNKKIFYEKVRAGKTEEATLDCLSQIANMDNREHIGLINQPLSFFIAKEDEGVKLPQIEEKLFFPYIAREIVDLAKRNFRLNQIAILVKDRYQAEALSSFLWKKNIYSQMKSHTLLRDSPAFTSLKEILQATLECDIKAIKKALFSPLINAPLEKEIDEEIVLKFSKLNSALKKSLPCFFKELFEEKFLNQTFLQMLLQEKNLPLLRDLMAIVELFLEYDLKNSDPFAFFNYVDALEEEDEKWCKSFPPDEDGVQIMTIHASKGLEFEVVFALGVAFCNDKIDDQEESAEKLRQLYVALTRAKNICLIPIVFYKNGYPSTPINIFFKTFFEPNEEAILNHLKQLNLPFQIIKEVHCPELQKREKIELSSTLPVVNNIPASRVLSFSSLSMDKDIEYTKIEKQSNLPLGSETGIFFHRIMEKIMNEQLFKEEEILSLIKEESFLSSFQGDIEIVKNIVQKTLILTLNDGEKTFHLTDIKRENLQTEVEFLFPLNEKQFMKGFIDLIFIVDEKYYIIDWKSNYLGDKKENFSNKLLKEVMEKENYLMQGSIYYEATSRLFKNKKKFGGIFYIFLRGCLFEECGVFHFFPGSDYGWRS